MRKKRSNPHEEPLVNLTPLIDVVFVILFTFIVVAPLLETDRVELASALQTSEQKCVEEKSPICIHVFADNAITFNKQYVSLDELSSHLEVARTHYPQAIPQLFHDKKASFGTYQEIKNTIEGAGFIQMDVILKPS